MADYLDGLRKMFGLGTGTRSMRGKQLQTQEDQMQPELRQAPVQPAAMPMQGVLTPEQQWEMERQERDRRLQMELERIRSGG